MYSTQYSQQLRKVYLCADVYAVFLQHALSTEKEEVMGLLIGDVNTILISYNINCNTQYK